MLYSCIPPVVSRRRQPIIAIIVLAILWYAWPQQPQQDEAYYRVRFPLAWKHIHLAREKGKGGVWYIPPHWLNSLDAPPLNIYDAAKLAHTRAIEGSHTLEFSTIPSVVHQTWKNTKINTWGEELAAGVEQWLTWATYEVNGNASMAYFFWLDDGCKKLIEEAEPEIVEMVEALPLKVEKSDVFRVVVLNTFGGIYGDVDTTPLRSPNEWVDATDLTPWKDPKSGKSFDASSSPTNAENKPIQLLLGIEGDNPDDTDTYWRTGYNFPVQLTQWALASAPQNPILTRLIASFNTRLTELASPYGGNMTALADSRILEMEDPLKLTGPEAITEAAMRQLDEEAGLRWNALTGLQDGGRSKAVGSTMIFPITAFSPGRGRFGNMGSKPVTHRDARVLHRGQGSWKKHNPKVEFGKFCRTAFGLCRNWAKVPH